MNKQEKIKNFDPSQPGLADESIFGLPFTAEESEIIIDATEQRSQRPGNHKDQKEDYSGKKNRIP